MRDKCLPRSLSLHFLILQCDNHVRISWLCFSNTVSLKPVSLCDCIKAIWWRWWCLKFTAAVGWAPASGTCSSGCADWWWRAGNWYTSGPHLRFSVTADRALWTENRENMRAHHEWQIVREQCVCRRRVNFPQHWTARTNFQPAQQVV